MTMMKLAILLIVALTGGTYECAASCAAVKCESSCHHDKKAPEACSHELVLHRTAAPTTASTITGATGELRAIAPAQQVFALHEIAFEPARAFTPASTPPLRV
jgi:hypothetical protein